jgi:hypothetical protein
MASTIVGRSGLAYVQDEVLQRHRGEHKLCVFKAEYVSIMLPSYSPSVLWLFSLRSGRLRLEIHQQASSGSMVFVRAVLASTPPFVGSASH